VCPSLQPGHSTSIEMIPALHSETPATRSPNQVSSLGSKSWEGPADSVGANSELPSPKSVASCGTMDVSTPSTRENIMGSLEQRNANASTPTALQDWVLSVTWHPDDVHLQGVQMTQVIDDAVFVSSSEMIMIAFVVTLGEKM